MTLASRANRRWLSSSVAEPSAISANFAKSACVDFPHPSAI
jgi:hypothetical protein